MMRQCQIHAIIADVLRVFRKWEGKGYGMSTLVNLCLENRIDLPYYRIYTEEVCLFLNAGKLVGERMERIFSSFDAHLSDRLNGGCLNDEQKMCSGCYSATTASRGKKRSAPSMRVLPCD